MGLVVVLFCLFVFVLFVCVCFCSRFILFVCLFVISVCFVCFLCVFSLTCGTVVGAGSASLPMTAPCSGLKETRPTSF